jgi:hypothetical protein
VDNSIDRQLIPSQSSDFVLYGGLTRDVFMITRPQVRDGTPPPAGVPSIATASAWDETYMFDLFDWYLHVTERLDGSSARISAGDIFQCTELACSNTMPAA